jgi:hypothetical protein
MDYFFKNKKELIFVITNENRTQMKKKTSCQTNENETFRIESEN